MLDTGTGTGTGTTCRVNTEQNYTVPDGRVGTRPLRQFRENVEIKELFHGFGDPGNIHYCAFLGWYRSSLPVSI